MPKTISRDSSNKLETLREKTQNLRNWIKKDQEPTLPPTITPEQIARYRARNRATNTQEQLRLKRSNVPAKNKVEISKSVQIRDSAKTKYSDVDSRGTSDVSSYHTAMSEVQSISSYDAKKSTQSNKQQENLNTLPAAYIRFMNQPPRPGSQNSMIARGTPRCQFRYNGQVEYKYYIPRHPVGFPRFNVDETQNELHYLPPGKTHHLAKRPPISLDDSRK